MVDENYGQDDGDGENNDESASEEETHKELLAKSGLQGLTIDVTKKVSPQERGENGPFTDDGYQRRQPLSQASRQCQTPQTYETTAKKRHKIQDQLLTYITNQQNPVEYTK
ncbi:hypothetical protein RFI_18616 [Reticulomyxa filosa]|uniref:Uncharacterized protein n=1 Tax=Reticulomyxa filosa TaxID=46433 RepID=X6MXT0_RETFI|nr:hypothetical protein RFI_18616 [Reticulomyxa filosa]|eukprot:ETO18646.1 hypothetical protein RFI_18616 [Reticulomyxa filosa]